MTPDSRKKWFNSLCDVPGLLVGHATNSHARTGCTAILAKEGAVAGVDVRGSAPGTREIELLYPVRLVSRIHALLLTGGSAYGLAAATGVQQYLEEQGIGFDTGPARVPIVPAAVIYDLATGAADVRPDSQMGYAAADAAHGEDQSNGQVGAGTGATVGKISGFEYAMPGGLGQAAERIGDELIVAAMSVVNPFGDVICRRTGKILCGARSPDGIFLNTMKLLRQKGPQFNAAWTNTTLAVVATNAKLGKEQVTKVAQMAQDGLARSINPAHTLFDGDIVFALSCGEVESNAMLVGAVAAELVSRSIEKAISEPRG